jgi:transcriptional regulator with XRE-family HTH domain
VVTEEQKAAFQQALRHEREKRGWSQRQLARGLGLSQSTVSYWEQGKSLPEPANVIELERTLELEPGELAHFLGYMRVSTMREAITSVLNAVMSDPDLGEEERELLLTMYRQLVRQSRAKREAGQGGRGSGSRQQQHGS